MSRHVRLVVVMAGAALALILSPLPAPSPAWAGPVNIVSRELDVFAEAARSEVPVVTEAHNAVDGGLAPLAVEAFIPSGGRDARNPNSGAPGFISTAGTAPGNLAVGTTSMFFGNVRPGQPPNMFTATAFEAQTVINASAAPLRLTGDFFVPAPTVLVLDAGSPRAPPDPRLPGATAFFEVTTRLTGVDGITVGALKFLYGVQTFRNTRTAEVFAEVIGSATGLEFSTGAVGQRGFAVPALSLFDFNLGSLAPGETMRVTARYVAQITNGAGESGAAAFIGDPNNLSASGARFTLETADGTGPVDPPPGPTPDPTAIPAPAGWTVLAAALAALSMVRGARRRS